MACVATLILAALGCAEPEPRTGEGREATTRQALASVRVTQTVAAGAYHSLFLKGNGEVWAWGQNAAGQLGTGSTSSTPLPQPSRVNGLPPIQAIAAGIAHSLALDTSGDVWAWGQNANGQAGLGVAGGTVLVPTKVPALSGIQAIAANGHFSLALDAQGRLWAWGQNTSGQLGTGAAGTAVSTPGLVPGLPALRAVAAGVNHVLALGVDGSVWGWGSNTSAQVGTGATSATVLTPVQVAGLPLARAVAAGVGHSLIVDAQSGDVWAWGQNTFGQVGQGGASTAPVLSPVQVGGVSAVSSIAAGHHSSMAILEGGVVKAWGHNVAGQLGDGTTVNSATPVNVTGLADATALAAGAQHALALRPGCPVWGWGGNGQGQLGTGTASTSPTTAPVSTLLVNTYYFDGDLDGFGDEYLSEQACEPSPGFVEDVDCDDYTPTTYPGAPETCNGADDSCDGVVDDGNPGGGDSCATGMPGVCAAGTMACFEGSVVCQPDQAASAEQCDGLDNDCDGEADDGNPGGLRSCATGQLGVCGEGVTYCTTHGAIECAPTRGASPEVCDSLDNDCDGQADEQLPVLAWYRDQDGDAYGLTSQEVLACGPPSGHVLNAGDCDDANPAFHPGATELCDGADNDCDFQVDEGLPSRAWYRDEDGDGHGTADDVLNQCGRPAGYVANAGDCSDVNASIHPGAEEVCDTFDNNCDGQMNEAACVGPRLAGGEGHSLVLKEDGTVWARGSNRYGEVGDGTNTVRQTLMQVPGLTQVASLAASFRHSVAVKADGTVWAWGYNANGLLGDGTTTDRWTPGRVAGLTGVMAVSTSSSSSLALKSDGTVWVWGDSQGLMTPARVAGLSGVVAVAAGGNFFLALRGDGTVWSWGNNGYGQLGDGTTVARYTTPGPVPGLTGVVAISAGYYQALALKADGTVWAWGGNHYGQLGDGTTTHRLTPIQVPGLTGMVAVVASGYFSVALKADGTVRTWGSNSSGQLGDGTTTHRSTPLQVPGLDRVVTVAGGTGHLLALKADGTLWTLGSRIPWLHAAPTRSLMTQAQQLTAGSSYSLALKPDGTVWAWGSNATGNLGDGTTSQRLTPTQVNGLTGVVALTTGFNHVLVAKDDGTVWAWGNQSSGELGNGMTGVVLSPTQVW